jgi:hypothetical protein
MQFVGRRFVLVIGYADFEVTNFSWKKLFVKNLKYSKFLRLFLKKFRFVQCGWTGARSWDMCQIYDSLPISERHRIEKIEMLDEGELLVQLFQHYCITVAWIGELFQDIEIT